MVDFILTFFCSSSENVSLKVLLKLVNVWPNYCQNGKVANFISDSMVVVVLVTVLEHILRGSSDK